MILSPAIIELISTRNFHCEIFIWLEAKNRQTGAIERVGMHTGEGDRTINVEGQLRTYNGVGNVISVPEIEFSQGLKVKENEFTLNILSPEIENTIRAYDSADAPAQVHLGFYDAETLQYVDNALVIDGNVGPLKIVSDEKEEYASVSIRDNIDKAVRGLTMTKSEASQQAMYPEDDGFQYAAVAGTTIVKWGADEGGRVVKRARV